MQCIRVTRDHTDSKISCDLLSIGAGAVQQCNALMFTKLQDLLLVTLTGVIALLFLAVV